ncbi:MAG: HD domain-containing phosphohydrolase [Eubacteriales bacterium]|nr:HD domain-containing phosphohydrolase [Eubacteriales bacterium]
MEKKNYRIIQTDFTKEISHGICVSNLARLVAKKLALPEDMCYNLAVAGLVHDIGKLEMMKYIYDRNAMHIEEMRYVRTHAALGYALLNAQGYPGEIAEWVLYHHENYDGSGYPANRAGEEIPLGARILRVCDVFAALTSDRSYRKAFDKDTAIELMIAEVKNFDMRVFLAFQEVVNTEDVDELLKRRELDKTELELAMSDMNTFIQESAQETEV